MDHHGSKLSDGYMTTAARRASVSRARAASGGRRLLGGQVPLLLATVLALAGCTHEYPSAGGDTVKTVKRYDITQALAANAKVVVAGTQSGAVLVSRDGTRTWARQSLGPVSLIDLAVCPDGSFVGIDFNHKVWSGDADGAHWKASELEKPRVPLAVACDARGRWHVAGSGAKIARSTDKGGSWQVTDLNEDAQITAVQMIDEQHGVALGEFGLFATTDDGGASWRSGERLPGEFYPYAGLFVSRTLGYASGLAGTVLRTRDGGASWHKIGNSSQAALFRLFMHDGRPYGVGAGGVVARLAGDRFETVRYPDVAPVALGAGTSLPGRAMVVVGGAGGLVRVIDTQDN